MLFRNLAKFQFSKYKAKVTQLLINGKFVNSISGKTFETINPATEKAICSIQQAGPEDAELAVKAARNAFETGPWRKMSGYERGRLMNKFADLLEKNRDEIADLESQDNGKTLWFSNNVDVELAIKCYRYYAGWADKIQGQVIPVEGPHFCYLRQEPVGVAAQIIPWNFPLLMQAWKWAPLMACGAVSIMKPAEQTPLTALRIGELAMEAGFPDGVLNVLPGFGDVGAYLVKHKNIDKVAFTGSTEVGVEIMRNAPAGNLKRVTLELGGKSPNIICHDADIDAAIEQSQLALYLNHGQCCCAGSRLFVHEKIYDEFVAKSVEKSKSIKVGDPFDPEVSQGPQVDKAQFDKILGYIKSGKDQGAKLMCGGERHGTKGYFIQPTVFSDVQDNMKIAQEEIFGPVMSIFKFKSYDEVIARANDNAYGLAAGIMTKDIEIYQKLVNALKAGTVWVNCYDVLQPSIPFGGYKSSGIGRELGEVGLRNYLEMKAVVIKRSEDTLP